jgi:hypothetical protein
LHFSPAVIQLNRDNPIVTDKSVYLAQVTNSVLDSDTVKVTASFPASKLVIKKLTANGNSAPIPDAAFGENGAITLLADPSSSPAANRICGVNTEIKKDVDTGCGAGGELLPAGARPTGTPVGVIRADGAGFQIYTTWYKPPADNWDNCPTSSTTGTSYVTLHEVLANGTWAQLYGIKIEHQYVTGVQFVGTTLFITAGDGTAPWTPPNENFGQTLQTVPQSLSSLAGDRYVRTAWTERLDVD